MDDCVAVALPFVFVDTRGIRGHMFWDPNMRLFRTHVSLRLSELALVSVFLDLQCLLRFTQPLHRNAFKVSNVQK